MPPPGGMADAPRGAFRFPKAHMKFTRYFKQGQQVLLRLHPNDNQSGTVEALSATVETLESNAFELALPYQSKGGEEYPLAPRTPVELTSEALGLGVRLTGTFEERVSANHIRVSLNDDLQIFQRRQCPRLDLTAGVRYSRGKGALRSFHQQWEKTSAAIAKGLPLEKLGTFPRCSVNLSESGVRFRLKAPTQVAELCLLLLQLEPDTPPVCALAEVVWIDSEISDGRQTAGLRFMNLSEKDRGTISAYLKKNAPPSPE